MGLFSKRAKEHINNSNADNYNNAKKQSVENFIAGLKKDPDKRRMAESLERQISQDKAMIDSIYDQMITKAQ